MPLAQLIQDYLVTNHVLGEILVPVPMQQKRLIERCNNESSLLASGLGRLLNLVVV